MSLLIFYHARTFKFHLQELSLPLINFVTLTPFSEVIDFFFFYSAFKQLLLLSNQDSLGAEHALLSQKFALLYFLLMILLHQSVLLLQLLQLVDPFLFACHFIFYFFLMTIPRLKQLLSLFIGNVRQFFGSGFLKYQSFDAVLQSIGLLLTIFV